MTKKIILLVLLLTFFLAGCNAQATTIPVQSQPSDQAPEKSVPVSQTIPTTTALPPTSLPPTVTPTETQATERTSPIDGMPQVYVPAGVLRMGGLDVYSIGRDESPAHTVSLDAFWVDQLEVTNAMYMLCVQAGDCTSPVDWASDRRFSYFNNEEFKDYPVVHVTWGQASLYCAWVERRLPTEAEWERAARGDDFRNYPWGDEPPNEMYANFNRLVNDTSRVGSYAPGASPFGALDMAGNVWEWVADLYSGSYYSISPEHNPPGPETNGTNLRVIRGGSFQDEWINLRVSRRGMALGPNPNASFDAPERIGNHSSKIGFRCAADE